MPRGPKSEKLALAWELLYGKKFTERDGSCRVNFPLLLLQNKMSYPYASQMLSKLEAAKYLRKVTLGGRSIEYVVLLKDVEKLGDDVLGTKEEDQRPARMHSPRISKSAAAFAPPRVPAPVPAQAAAQRVRPHVVLLVDYENNAIPLLKAAGSEFPTEGLFKFARGKGILLTERVFIPSSIAYEERRSLRRSGWKFIVDCPSLKDGGGDTVDRTIEQEIGLLLRIPSVGTFIIVSRDADFQDARRMVENHGRTCIFVYYDEKAGEMRSENGERIELSIKPQVLSNGRNGVHRNGFNDKFSGIICGIETGMIAYDPADALHGFIGAAVAVLQQRSVELQNPKFRKHFMALCDSVWIEVSANRNLRRDFSREDVRDLLTAFNNSRVLRKYNRDEFTYYTFDDTCSFVKALMQAGAL